MTKKNIFVVNQTEKTLSTCIMMWFDEKKNLLRKSNHRKIRQIARWCVLTKKIFSFFTVGFLDIFFREAQKGTSCVFIYFTVALKQVIAEELLKNMGFEEKPNMKKVCSFTFNQSQAVVVFINFKNLRAKIHTLAPF